MTSTDINAILDLADRAARCVLGRGHWTRQDWEDAKQEAAAAIWSGGTNRHEGILFLTAKNAIIDWLRRWLRSPRGCEYLDYIDHTRAAHAVPDTAYLAALAPWLEQQRAMKVQEDIRYLELRMQGYSTDGIALEMGLTPRRVYAVRERLLPRLERIARGEIPPTHGEAIRAGRARRRNS